MHNMEQPAANTSDSCSMCETTRFVRPFECLQPFVCFQKVLQRVIVLQNPGANPFLSALLLKRHCEFGRAVLTRQLEGRRPQVSYIGCLRADQQDVVAALEGMVYEHWDGSSSAPPRSRPTEVLPEPTLNVLSWSGGQPIFPDSLLQKFAEGTSAHQEMSNLKKQLEAAFPAQAGTTTQSQSRNGLPPGPGRNPRPRASGRPDFSIEGGHTPVDPTRLLDLVHTPADSFSVERRGI